MITSSTIFSKNFYYSFILLALCACTEDVKKTTSESDSDSKREVSTHNKNFAWLLGKWERTNDKKGQKTYENWQQSSDSLYQGLGFTMEGTDTVFKENIEILNLEGNWNFKVTGVNEQPVYFAINEQTGQSFSCLNPTNEFPKEITYRLNGDTLEATISAGNIIVPFYFVKSN